jgi:hypothetical protein
MKPKYTLIYYSSSSQGSSEEGDEFDEEPTSVFDDKRLGNQLKEI